MFDDEQRALTDIERELEADQKLSAAFDRHERDLRDRGHRRGAQVAAGVAVVAGLGLLMMGSVLGAVATMVTTGLIWLAWRCPDSTSPQ
ncbi:hypothetical protein PSU4_40460 [Pseudonocardia sulfidoxydans NBRC 16205]|uniref:DUF3040 domain-containing protein n=1 Tax=Pseudonocardia sulfidoxydans NBRC 16205 TaxID=1223511 RepID=A0A511DJW8_9PSEU|nr:DUF3040 domain-containing protein [Pseudonocardia sulfidoxydans]GEL25092.1 hypothetical protein PSU4_40460 [Pseudonocardia sulfidoxydans NBRC 16205]